MQKLNTTLSTSKLAFEMFATYAGNYNVDSFTHSKPSIHSIRLVRRLWRGLIQRFLACFQLIRLAGGPGKALHYKIYNEKMYRKISINEIYENFLSAAFEIIIKASSFQLFVSNKYKSNMSFCLSVFHTNLYSWFHFYLESFKNN